MKKSLFILFAAAAVLHAAEWQFAYPEWKFKAVTFSYDDGMREDRQLIGIFDRYKVKATFNLSVGAAKTRKRIMFQPAEVKKIYKNHEVASHGYLHRKMAQLNDRDLEEEIVANQQALAKILGAAPLGFAYPYSSHTSKKAPARVYDALKKHGLVYARTCQKNPGFDLPANWMAWAPNGHHNQGLEICKRYKALKPNKMTVCFIWGHSYEFGRGRRRWYIIENICKLIANQPDIWYATNLEIAQYVQACEAVKAASKFPEMVNPTNFTIYMVVDGKKITLPPGKTLSVK